MSQKTLFNKTALAVAVAIVSTSAWSAGFQLNEFSSSGLGVRIPGKVQLLMMQVTPVVTLR
ncbi:aromatic hydrocarbon degradation membrane protein [Enterobacter cloacae]|uniref:Aromatic hydrocarbon degradation membrane protein n=1 Tax=Enterobacter cloacae TaxID=550 RepID=A0A377LW87_ENTCL|nr:aromatic hydrocarbon degradation membrane protein [Enterobacter cloacae]